MPAVIRDLSELSTSVAIASSIWLLRKKKRWARLRAAWAQRWRAGRPEAPAASGLASASILGLAPAGPLPPAGASNLPVQRDASLRTGAQRAQQRPAAPLESIEVVEDSDWQVWEAALASQPGPGRAP